MSKIEIRNALVHPFGFPMECRYEYEPGAPAQVNDYDGGDPGYAPTLTLLACRVGGHDIYEMLTEAQVLEIEQVLLEREEALS